MAMFGGTMVDRFNYIAWTAGRMGGEPSFASLCKECGKCVKACPQHLPIPELLKDVAGSLEPWWFKPAAWALEQLFMVDTWGIRRRARKGERLTRKGQD